MNRRSRALIAVAVAVGVAVGAGARIAGYSPVKVTSGSMESTIDTGDWILVHARDENDRLDRGDIVMFRFPLGTDGRAIKRVVAVGGDRVEFTPTTFKVNGRTTRIGGAPRPDLEGAIRVPPGQVFLLGDHAEVSIDSRSFGPVPTGEAVGRVAWVLG